MRQSARRDIENANRDITDPLHPFPLDRYQRMAMAEIDLYQQSGREFGGVDEELMAWLSANGYRDNGQVVRREDVPARRLR